MIALLLCACCVFPPADSLDVRRLVRAPMLDGRVDDAEYGAPSIRIATAAGAVTAWVGRHDGYLYIAASLPDSSFYWGDDFVVSLDPDGSGGSNPGDGDRQWYLRRMLDSSVVLTATGGRWETPGKPTPMLGATRHHADWDVASASMPSGWTIELRIRESALSAPRLALRTYNDAPRGWWSWPAPAAGVLAQRVERSPDQWVVLRLK
jgi:hypothetical protein